MAKHVAVAIGVKRAGRLTELPGAVNGAKEFYAWAALQGYAAHLVTDEIQPVTAQALKALFETILDDGDVERLLVYFAGHGIQPAVNTAFWLLSRWEDDSDEAINVNLSFSNAKRSGIGQISVFSDACRSTVPDAASVGGRSIFPKTVASVGRQPQWDHFLASRMGEIAQEVPGQDPAKAYGIFTRCIMQALSGAADKAIESRFGHQPPRVVTSATLANFLEEIVPLESGKTPGASVQFPEVISGWRSPKDIYLGLAETPQPRNDILDRKFGTPGGGALESVDRPDLLANRANRHTDGAFRKTERDDDAPSRRAPRLPERPRAPERPREPRFSDQARAAVADATREADATAKADAAVFAQGEGRQSFETMQGLTLIDAMARAVVINGRVIHRAPNSDLFEESGAVHVRGDGGQPQSAALELEEMAADGGHDWVGACILPKFVGTIVIKDGLAASLNYVPARNSGRYVPEASELVAPVLHRWTALMHQGRFGDYREFERVAGELRKYKHSDPSLGILAAYAYERAGKLDQIDDIADWFIEMSQPIPFDVALLSTAPISRAPGGGTIVLGNGRRGQVAGAFPLMTQGWSFLDPEDDSTHPGLLKLRAGLRPALWTTLRAREGQVLADMVQRGEL